MIDVIIIVRDLMGRGVEVRSLSEGIDPFTPNRRLMLNLMATFAKYERELIREPMRAGVEAGRARGVRFGRPPVDPDWVARNLRTVTHLGEAE